MATIKAVNKGGGASPKARIEYVEDELKTSPELMTGINCSSDPELAIEDMRFTKEVWNKPKGRQTLHFVQSFAPGEGTPEEVHAIGVEFAQKNPAWEGYEVFVATHTNRDCLHNHFVINTVSIVDGHKIQISRDDLLLMRDLNDEICHEHGYSVPEQIESYTTSRVYNDKRIGYSNEAYAVLQKNKTTGTDSYIVNIRAAIADVMKNLEPETKEQFIEAMQERGIAVRWKKHITYTDLQRQEAGEKKCKIRDKKLQQIFPEWDLSKENLMERFSINQEKHQQAEIAQTTNYSETWEEEIELPAAPVHNSVQIHQELVKFERFKAVAGKALNYVADTTPTFVARKKAQMEMDISDSLIDALWNSTPSQKDQQTYLHVMQSVTQRTLAWVYEHSDLEQYQALLDEFGIEDDQINELWEFTEPDSLPDRSMVKELLARDEETFQDDFRDIDWEDDWEEPEIDDDLEL